MSSLIPEYEYDIFISYRQKDNKHDGWVTEFVENLKGELESTFKEEISVYFDINPHDGLLETYDVDASLKDKLKCLVFIPIISRTYCDPKSFAWEHEFKAFVEEASQDNFGLKIKLPNGNVANRVLPIRIHDLDNDDIKLCEAVIGGVLRGIEFIYRESGFNRPLKPDNDEKINLNKTKYRNQITKVALAIKEIIIGLKTVPDLLVTRKSHLEESMDDATNEDIRKAVINKRIISQKSKKWLILLLSTLLCVAGAFVVFKIIEGSKTANDISKFEKSIAVLPFVNDSPDQQNIYFINGIMDEILNNLQKIKNFRVLSRTSTEQYRGSNKPAIPKIAKDLDVNYIVEGSGQKYGTKFVLRVQLIAAKNEKHIWGESYNREIKETTDIIDLQSQIAQAIASELKATITPEEKQLIEKIPTANLTAYDFYQRGNDELRKHLPPEFNPEAVKKAEALFLKALEYDSTFAQAYAGLADALWIKWDRDYTITESIKNKLADSMLVLANIALSYDNQLSYAYVERGGYYEVKGTLNQALEEYDKALKYNQNDWIPYAMKGFLYGELDLRKSLENFQKGASYTHGPELIRMLENLGTLYYMAGFPEKGNFYFLEVLKLDADSVKYNDNKIRLISATLGNYKEAAKYFENRYLADSTNTEVLISLGRYYAILGQNKESLIYFKKYLSKLEVNRQSDTLNVYIGYAYLQNGYRKEADYYFNRTIAQINNRLKLMRPGMKIYDLYALAQIYECRGDKAQAYENLRNFDQNPSYTLRWVTTIKNDPIFNSIRKEPEFQRILKDVEAKYQAEHERVRKWLEEQGKL